MNAFGTIEIPRVANCNIRVPFVKKPDGSFDGIIGIVNLQRSEIAFKINATDPEMFDYQPSYYGIIPRKGMAKVKVTTSNKKLGWGDVRKQLFLVQSIPLVARIQEEIGFDLEALWEEDVTLMESEKMLLVPEAGVPSFANEPSVHEQAVQGYLQSPFVRLNRYFRNWNEPYILDEPIFQKNYPEAFRQLDEQLGTDSWFWSFKNRVDLICTDNERLQSLEKAYKCGWTQLLIFCMNFNVACFSAWWFWTKKLEWDEFLEARERNRPWYEKLMEYLFGK